MSGRGPVEMKINRGIIRPSLSRPLKEKSSANKGSEKMGITLQMIEYITEGFSKEKLVGSGGYGEVYRGVLNGKEIAIKKLFPMHELDDVEFEKECKNLMKVQHKNVLRLVDYCYQKSRRPVEQNGQFIISEVTDRALCFPYIELGSLSQHISAKSCKHAWPTTYKIIKGICEGLHYINIGLGDDKGIYHLDLKPDNILLGQNMVPKVGDFGLSRLFGDAMTHQTSTKKGTIEFMPPEYIDNLRMKRHTDVFSLGVVIFYLMAGKVGYLDYCDSRSSQQFEKEHREVIARVQEYWKKKTQSTQGYTWDRRDHARVTKCIEIAMTCVDNDRDKRPTTAEIINDLSELDDQVYKRSKNVPKQFICQENSVKDSGKDIAVDPSMELRFPFEPNRDIPCCLQLTNKADSFIAFNIKTDQNKYHTQPNKGILPPCSKCYITLTLQAQEKAPPSMQCLDMFIVQSTRVSESFTSREINEDFIKKASAVDEVTLPVVYVEFDRQPSI